MGIHEGEEINRIHNNEIFPQINNGYQNTDVGSSEVTKQDKNPKNAHLEIYIQTQEKSKTKKILKEVRGKKTLVTEKQG